MMGARMMGAGMMGAGMISRRWIGGAVAAGLAVALLTGCGQGDKAGSGSAAAVVTPATSSTTASTASAVTTTGTGTTAGTTVAATTSGPPAVPAPTTAVATIPVAVTSAPDPAAQSSALNQVSADLGRVDAGTAQTDKEMSAAASAQAQNDQP
jgi:hypothetical protein